MVDIRRYIAILSRWWWLILVGALVAGGSAYLVSSNMTPVYRASARYLIDQAPGTSTGTEYSQLLAEQRLAETYAEIMAMRPVLQATITELDLPFTENKLANMVTVVAQGDTQVLSVIVQDIDADRAAQIANTIGAVFILQNEERESSRYSIPIENWENILAIEGEAIVQLNADIATLSTVDNATNLAEYQQLQLQLNEAQSRYNKAFDTLNQLQIDLAKESSNIVVIEEAVKPDAPIRPRIIFNTFIAVFVGGFLALSTIVIVEFLDDTIKTPDEVQADTKLAALGAIPAIDVNEPSREERKRNLSRPEEEREPIERLVTFHQPRSPITEAYRMLRTNLMYASVDEDLETIIVTSASPSDGKSTTASNMAVVMSQLDNHSVIIVDADLRKPTQHRVFQASNNFGLSTAIIDSSTPVTNHLQQTKIRNLKVLTSGPIPPDPADLLNSKRMLKVIEELKQHADLIIIDTPPVLSVADASILASNVNGCVLVAQVGKTKRGALKEAVKRLEQSADINLLGLVMNRTTSGRGYYYDYYYRNYYGGAYGEYGETRTNRKKGKKRDKTDGDRGLRLGKVFGSGK